MAGKSNIEWTEHTWNPIAGCSVVSPGCTNCYAMKMAARIEAALSSPNYICSGARHYLGTTKRVNGNAVWTGKVALAPEHILLQPLRRKKPTTYFVNSMGDLFHEAVPDEWIDRVFAVMALCPQHTFQVLTKRAARMCAYMSSANLTIRIWNVAVELDCKIHLPDDHVGYAALLNPGRSLAPLPNVWLGVSTERQQEADERIPHLLTTPAAVRFISAEPLLGSIDLTTIKAPHVSGTPDDSHIGWTFNALATGDYYSFKDDRGYNEGGDGPCREYALDWVIVGGESGPDARPYYLPWARSLRDQCASAGTAFFFKQHGEWLDGTQYTAAHLDADPDPEQSRFACMDWDGERYVKSSSMWCDDLDEHAVYRVGKNAAGRFLDGVEHNGMPGRATA